MNGKQLADRLIAAFLPDRCAFCGDVIAHNTEICPRCKNELHRQEQPICYHCGRSKPHCQCKKDGKRKWDGITAPLVYETEGVTGEAVRRLKRSNNRKNAATLGREIASCVRDSFPDVAFDCVMPVPMHPKDKLKRGYSQSAWLAETVAEELSIPFEDMLLKIERTQSQKGLLRQNRRANLRGAFDVNEMFDAPDKTVLLIDDVITTGATVDECATVLKIYGVRAVYVAAVCTRYKKGTENHAGSKAGN